MIMALLYAPDDFSRAQTIVCTSGWDTDCNAGNVGCLMGAMLGLDGIEAGRRLARSDRRPHADFLRLTAATRSTTLCGSALRLVDLGRKLAGLPPRSRRRTERSFISPCPAACRDSCRPATEPALVVDNVSFEDARALQVRYAGLGAEPAAP